MKTPSTLSWRSLLALNPKAWAWVLGCSAVFNLMALVPTLYMLQVFDRVMGSQNPVTLIALTVWALGFLAMQAFAEALRSRLLVRLGQLIDHKVSPTLFDAMARQSLMRGAPPAGTDALQAFNQWRQALTGPVVALCFDLPWVLAYLAVLALMHPALGALALALSALSAGLLLQAQRHDRRDHELSQASWQHAQRQWQMQSAHRDTLRVLGMAPSLLQRWRASHETAGHHGLQASESALHRQGIARLVQGVQQALGLALGAWLVMRGELSAGAMIAATTLTSQALRPLGALGSTWWQWQQARVNHQTVLHTLQQAEPHQEASAGQASHAAAPTASASGLTLHGVSAHTAQGQVCLPGPLDLVAPAGQITAITGPSGAGKTTLLACAMGVWPGQSGQVSLHGQDMVNSPREQVGPRVGYLPQEVRFGAGTVAEHIARLGPVRPEQVVQAAQAAGVHEMVLRLPRGYETPLGPGGVILSGGQRQRLALARALYGQPELLVLDEPTAHLDEAGMACLKAALQACKQRGCIVLMTLHQKALLPLADQVVPLNPLPKEARHEHDAARLASTH